MPLPDASTERLALAYYYIWFTKGWFDGSDTPSLKAAMSDIHPVIGPYDSHDEDVIAAHMEQCVRAKLDALAVSWYYNKRNKPTLDQPKGAHYDDILESVIKIGSEHGLRICIDMEAASFKTSDDLYNALKHYLGRYKDDSRVLHAQNKPVVLCWSTWKLGSKVWSEVTSQLAGEGLGGFWVASNQMETEYLNFLDALECYTPLSTTETVMEQYTRIRSEVDAYNETPAGKKKPGRWHGTVMPGFDDRCIPKRLDRDDYMHFRLRRGVSYYWETFAAVMASRADWLHITSFNELAEHSHIEETIEDGDRFIRLTAEMVDQFKACAC